jgi:excisionase family DNA binding protein
MQQYHDTKSVADFLGVRRSRVRQLIRSGVLPGVKMGGVWLIAESDLIAYKKYRRKRGRPIKQEQMELFG